MQREYVYMLSFFGRVWLFATLWTVACQAFLSMGFSRQEYWSGLSCPPLGDLPNPGLELRSVTLQVDSLPSEPAASYTVGPWLSICFILGMHMIGSVCPISSQVFLKATLVSLPAFRKLDEHGAEFSEMPCLQTLWASRWIIPEAR